MCYRNDRPGTAGGSTAVAVRHSLEHHRVLLPATTHLEITAVEMLNTLGGVFLVVAYKPPQKELLHPDLAVAFDAHRRVIMAGDLNCKHRDWNSRLTAPNGKRLRRFADSRRVAVVRPAQPTFYPSQLRAAPDVLDIAVIQGIDCPVQVSALTELSSSHLPILIHVATQHLSLIHI